MNKKLLLIIIVSLLIFPLGKTVKAENATSKISISAALSDWKPYAYMENGKVAGFAYEIAKNVFERAQVTLQYDIWPWARVIQTGLKEKNFMIGGLGRTPKREKLFHWVGPVTKGVDVFFYKLKTNPIKIKTLEDLKNYKVGVTRGTYTHDYLVMNGLEKSIHFVIRADQLLRMLEHGRIDFFIMNKKRFLAESKANNIDHTKFTETLFAFKAVDYMAFNRETSVCFQKVFET